MASLRDLLHRFRPVGTPGAAARPGVPVDRAAELDSELGPVLALLAETQLEAQRTRDRASAEAASLRQQAGAQADAVIADAESRVAVVRATAAAQDEAASDEEELRIDDAARRAADRIRLRAQDRLPDLLAEAMKLLDGDPG